MRRAVRISIVLASAAFAFAARGASTLETRSSVERRSTVDLFVKGGVGGFTGDLSNVVQTGPTWGVTLALQPWTILGLELGYEGSRNTLSDTYVSGFLTRHGGNVLVKLSPPFLQRVRPFVGAGVGASFVTVYGQTNGLYQNGLMEEVPLAAGLEVTQGAFTAGLRATYRLLYGDHFASTALGNQNPTGGLFDTALTVGGRF